MLLNHIYIRAYSSKESKKISFVIYLFLLVFGISRLVAQDPVFSQYYAAPSFLNPGMISDVQGLEVTINSRLNTNKEFSQYNLNHVTIAVPLNMAFLYGPGMRHDHRTGLALSAYREATGNENGKLNTLGFILSFSHCIQLQREHYLSLGIQGGYVNKHISDDFMWGSQYVEDYGYDPDIIPSVSDLLNLNAHIGTISAGLVYYYNSSSMLDYFKKNNFDAFLGVSVYNLNTPNQSFFDNVTSELPLQTKVHGGIKYSTNKKFYIFPNMLWVHQNGNNQINIGAYTNIRTFKSSKEDGNNFNTILGVWYRFGDSFIASLGTHIGQFKFAVSYDFNTSNFKINNHGKGTCEISLKYSIVNAKNKRLERGLIYPSF
ncbi:MAG: PorP/SprF family type IX secretion system membrane protein [Bacteroidales bacterium]|nr:PorP/SprF family type IX secretion system membrane protein [Bacteroidales bacterium]